MGNSLEIMWIQMMSTIETFLSYFLETWGLDTIGVIAAFWCMLLTGVSVIMTAIFVRCFHKLKHNDHRLTH